MGVDLSMHDRCRTRMVRHRFDCYRSSHCQRPDENICCTHVRCNLSPDCISEHLWWQSVQTSTNMLLGDCPVCETSMCC